MSVGKEKINVLSLFDGISCGQISLGKVGIEIENYFASEIDKHAINVTQHNYPNTKQLGGVLSVKGTELPKIDLLIGGSPCQDLSIAKKGRKGLDGERSGMFWEYVRILKEAKPKYFILENVASMPKEAKEVISKALGVQPIMINASLVSAQSRKRLFWTNIKVKGLPEDRGILLKDIIQPDAEIDERMTSKGKAYCLDASYYKGSSVKHSIEKKNRTMVQVKKENKEFNQIGYFGSATSNNVGGQALRVYDVEKKSPTSGVGLYKIGTINNSNSQGNRVYSTEGKSVSLSANGGGLGAKTGLYDINGIRKLTPIECERLQSLPDNYTEGISNTQRYKCLGNGFNVEVIKHILSFLPNSIA